MRVFLLLPLFLFGLIEKGVGPVNQVQIFGEMHSGTNFFEMVLEKNLRGVRIVSGLRPEARPFSQKHFPAWFTKPLAYHKSLGLSERYWTLEGSEKTLFVVIVRDPYDWIRSLYGNPFHLVRRRDFASFIRSPVEVKVSVDRINTIDFNPETRGPFTDPFAWRAAKMRNILTLPERVKNCFFVRYEALKEDPEGVVEAIAKRFGVERRRPFAAVTTYKRMKNKRFVEKGYFPISEKDLSYMNGKVDWNVEERLGYRKKTHVSR